MSQRTVPISIDELRVGVICSHPVEGDHGVLLLGANTRITQQVIAGLRDRGISSIEVDPRDLAALRGGAGKRRPASSARERSAIQQWPKSRPVKELLVDRHDESLSDERARQLDAAMDQAKRRMDELKQQITQRTIRSVAELTEISDGYARSIVDDHDQTVGAVGRAAAVLQPGERSIRMSALGMGIAIELGLDGPQMLDIGMAGLLHDVGLHTMDPKFLDRNRVLSGSEWWEYKKHPNVSADCICDVIDVNESVQLAVQQVHEQYDGSGYPRGLKGQRIHQHARILNVVDAFLRLTSAAGERAAIVPHDALGLILHLAGRGLFDPQVIRAFLNIETLFPLGSPVELSSGEKAQVIRRPRSGFAAPVVVSDEGRRIEMESAEVEIVRPLCDAAIGQVRLSPQAMIESEWHPAGQDVII